MSIVAKRLYVSEYLLIGTAVDLSLGDIVLDGDPALPPLKGHSPEDMGAPPSRNPGYAHASNTLRG